MDAYKIVIHGYAVDELEDANPIIYAFHDLESVMSALKFFDMAGICTCTFIPIDNLDQYIITNEIKEVNIGPVSFSKRAEIVTLFEKLVHGSNDVTCHSPYTKHTFQMNEGANEFMFYFDDIQ